MTIQRFTARPLRGLDGFYAIEGAQSRIDLLDLGPIQPVHDVEGMARAAQGFLTHWALTVGPTGGAGAPVFGESSRAQLFTAALHGVTEELAARNLSADSVDVWILGWSAVITAASAGRLAQFDVGIRMGTLSGGGVIRLLQRFDTEIPALVSGGALVLTSTIVWDRNGPMLVPFLMPDDPDTAILARAVDTAAAAALTATFFVHCWIAPKGTLPPGL